MELRQLQYLTAVAKEGSFTRAAEVSNVAQPALSRQIQKLERELGLPLADRTTRRVILTPAGQEVVATALRIQAELETLRQSLNQTRGLLQGTVTLGVTSTPGPVNVPKVLADFSRAHPGVELIVREGLSVELAAELRADRLDLALVAAIGTGERDQLALESCLAEQLAVVLPVSHRLATRDQLSIADLRDERFVTFQTEATIRGTIDRAAAEAGFVARASIETNDVARQLALVAEELGVAILPSTDANRGTSATVAIPLCRPILSYEIYLARRIRRQLGPAAQALRALILGLAS